MTAKGRLQGLQVAWQAGFPAPWICGGFRANNWTLQTVLFAGSRVPTTKVAPLVLRLA